MVIHTRVTGLDMMNVTGDGIYCIYPFSAFDSNGKGVYKIGLATGGTFYNRLESGYHTYLPMGFYYKCFLENPTIGQLGRTKLVYYREIEKFIFDNIKAHRVKSNARSRHDGETEWVYCNQKAIDDVFLAAYKKYGGKHTNLIYSHITDEDFKKEKGEYFLGKIKFI